MVLICAERVRLLLAGGALLAGLIGVCVIAASASDGYPLATDARVGGDDTQTRFVVDLSRKIDLRVFTLADQNYTDALIALTARV